MVAGIAHESQSNRDEPVTTGRRVPAVEPCAGRPA